MTPRSRLRLGAAKHEVRLRPAGDDDGRMDRAGQQALELLGNDDAENEDFRVAFQSNIRRRHRCPSFRAFTRSCRTITRACFRSRWRYCGPN